MSKWQDTAGSQVYKDAVAALESLESPSIGFVKPSDYKGVQTQNSVIFKQLNTIIQLLCVQDEGIRRLRERIEKLEVRSNSNPPDWTPTLDSLTSKLQALSLGEKAATPISRPSKYHFLKDPLKILQEEQEKAKAR